jgi:esterase/lipase
MLKADSLAVLNYLQNKMGLKGKIGVYGRSLGGIVTTYLAEKADMIIADRTFANFTTLSQRKFYNPISDVLFKVGSCGWQVSNDKALTFKGISNCYKLIITEKNDEVVDIQASLMIGVARLVSK